MSKNEPYSIELDESSPELSQNHLVGSKGKKSFLERMKEREKRQNKVKLNPRICQENYSKKSSYKAKSPIDNLNTSPLMKQFIKEEFEREKVKYSFLSERQVQLQVIQKYKSDIASTKRKSTKLGKQMSSQISNSPKIKRFKSGDSGFLDEGSDTENNIQRNKIEKRMLRKNNGRQKGELDSESDAEIMGDSSQDLHGDGFITTPGLLQKSQEKAELVGNTKTAFRSNPMHPIRKTGKKQTPTNLDKNMANFSKMITKRKSPKMNSPKVEISNASQTKHSSKKKLPTKVDIVSITDTEDSSILSKKCTGTPFGDGKARKSVKFLSQPLYDSDELPEKIEIRKAAKTKSILKPATPIKSSRVLQVTNILDSQSPPIKSLERYCDELKRGNQESRFEKLFNTPTKQGMDAPKLSDTPARKVIDGSSRKLFNTPNTRDDKEDKCSENFHEELFPKSQKTVVCNRKGAKEDELKSIKPLGFSTEISVIGSPLNTESISMLNQYNDDIELTSEKITKTRGQGLDTEVYRAKFNVDDCFSPEKTTSKLFVTSNLSHPTPLGADINILNESADMFKGEEEVNKIDIKHSEIEVVEDLVEGQYNQVADNNVPSTDAEETPHYGKMIKNQDVKLDQILSPDLNSSIDLFSDVEDTEDCCDNRESVGGSFQKDNIENQTETVLKSRKPMTSGTEVTVKGSPLIDGSFESTSSKKSMTDDLYSTLCWNELDSKPHRAKFQVEDCLSPENQAGRDLLQLSPPPVKVNLGNHKTIDCIVLSDEDVIGTKPCIGTETNVSSDMFSGGEDIEKIEIALATTDDDEDILGSEHLEDLKVSSNVNKEIPHDNTQKIHFEILSYPSSEDLFSEVEEVEHRNNSSAESEERPSEAENKNESPTKMDQLHIISPELDTYSDNEDIVEDVSQHNDGFLCDLFSEAEEADVPMESSQDSETTEDEENYKIF